MRAARDLESVLRLLGGKVEIDPGWNASASDSAVHTLTHAHSL